MARKRIAVLISGRGSNMTALLDAAAAPDYPAEIVLVLSNRAEAAGLAVAQARGVPTVVVESRSFGADRAAFEAQMQTALEQHAVEIVCLAGFMRLFTSAFVERWAGRMLNVHPALLPAFKGLDTHRRALEVGAKIHGATVHFVSPEMDAGPIIVQAATAVAPDDDEASLARRVLALEHRLYPAALRWAAEGRLSVIDGVCRLAPPPAQPDAPLIAPSIAETERR